MLGDDDKLIHFLNLTISRLFQFAIENLNSIPAHNYSKISLLTTYNLDHNFEIIYLSETYHNSETSI